jgi:hypothetical protein
MSAFLCAGLEVPRGGAGLREEPAGNRCVLSDALLLAMLYY